MADYTYSRWSGGNRTIVNIDSIEYTQTHILFKRYRGSGWHSGYFLVLAEREVQVNELREVQVEEK